MAWITDDLYNTIFTGGWTQLSCKRKYDWLIRVRISGAMVLLTDWWMRFQICLWIHHGVYDMFSDLVQALLLLLFNVFLGGDDYLLAIEDVEDPTQ